MSSTTDADLKKILDILMQLPENEIDDVLKTMPETMQHMLRTKFNIMKNPKTTPIMGDEKEILEFSIINIKEKYAQRFAMTSLIGFIYKMMEEWEPKKPINGVMDEDLISQNDPEFANIFNKKYEYLLQHRPIEIYNNIIKKSTNEINKLKNSNLNTLSDDDKQIKLLDLYSDLYQNDYKLNKFEYFLNNKLYKLENKKLQELENEKLKHETCINMDKKRLQILEIKLKLRKKFEGSEAQKLFNKNNKQQINRDSEQQNIDEYLENPDNTRLSKIDKLQEVAVFEVQIFNKNTIIKNNIHIVKDVVEQIQKQQTIIKKIEEKNVVFKKNINQIKTDYKIIFNEINSLESLTIDEYEPTDTEYTDLIDECKKELKITQTKEEFYTVNRNIIKMFLDEFLKYDPNYHIQCAYKPNYDDKLRIPLTEAYKKFISKDITKEEYYEAMKKYEKNIEKLQKQCEIKYERSIIPPDDTFCRLKRYTDNNFEYLKQATDDIYCEKSDFELSIVPLKYFKGKDEDDLNKQADEWERKYSKEFEGEVFRASFGIHNLLGPWTENREKTNFYTKETQILKSIIAQSEEDAKMGNKLMKDRINKGKKKNEKKYGKLDDKFKNYKNENMDEMNVKHVDDLDITFDKLKDINNIDESTVDEIEVEYINIKPDLKNKHRGYVSTGKFHIPAEKTLPENASAMSPADLHNYKEEEKMQKSIKNAMKKT